MRRRDLLTGLATTASGLHAAAPLPRPKLFESRWHSSPDMPWTGADCWAQPMQDWMVERGELVCRTAGPDRTVHLLTHQASARPAALHARLWLRLVGDRTGRAGLRIGIRGRYDDYRSAVMTGRGIDCALADDGTLAIGRVRARRRLTPAQRTGPVVLELSAVPIGAGRSRVALAAHGPDGRTLATVAVDLTDAALRGNVAIVSHFASGGRGGPAARFAHLALWGERLDVDPAHAFGPIYFAQYTVHDRTLRLAAQLAPLDLQGLEVRLEAGGAGGAGGWRELGRARPDAAARVAAFAVADWTPAAAVPYRLSLRPSPAEPWREGYRGTIAVEPLTKPVVRALTASCNWDQGFPDADVVAHAEQHDADLLLFLGDQYYEENGGFGLCEAPLDDALLDHLRKWAQFGWSFRDLFRHRPALFLVDDHDVYQGNLWGSGGRAAPAGLDPTARSDAGGYRMPAAWVNAVQRAQTAHLPPPYDPHPIDQGINTYFCEWRYAGISFAVVEDRKFKTAPRDALPRDARVANGYVADPGRPDPARAAAAELLGQRQLAFLRDWVGRAGDTPFRVLVSATPFACPHTLPAGARGDEGTWDLAIPGPGEYVDGDAPTPDLDANGWPQARRDEVLRLLAPHVSIHLTGDQHLAQVLRYGVDAHGDAFPAFVAPALCNYWPRRWWPPRAGHRALSGQPAYTGDWQDALGNRFTVHAAANPVRTGVAPALVHDLAPGYGVVDFHRATGRIIVHCWPRHADPRAGAAGQFAGWPVVFDDRARQRGPARRA